MAFEDIAKISTNNSLKCTVGWEKVSCLKTWFASLRADSCISVSPFLKSTNPIAKHMQLIPTGKPGSVIYPILKLHCIFVERALSLFQVRTDAFGSQIRWDKRDVGAKKSWSQTSHSRRRSEELTKSELQVHVPKANRPFEIWNPTKM